MKQLSVTFKPDVQNKIRDHAENKILVLPKPFDA